MLSGLSSETQRRQAMWENLVASGGPEHVSPGLVRQLGLYRSYQGVWVNKELTGRLSPDGAGIAVSVVHTGLHYADDLAEDGVIYHFPRTNRPGGRDASEIAALQNTFSLNMPIFVVTQSPQSAARRDVHLGWVVDIDHAAEQCLIEFSNSWSLPRPVVQDAGEFRLEANRTEFEQMPKRLKRNPRFAFEVGKRCGWRCAVCSMQFKHLLDAAHIRGVAQKGSDDPRNGLILCKNHHAAFDKDLLNFQPENGAVVVRNGISPKQLGVTAVFLAEEQRPHIEALQWRWNHRPKD
jgi:putative restriction endonuclease